MNDKCAAGTGRFLEIMADRLGISQQQMADLARSGEPTKISSMCTCLPKARSSAFIGRGEPRENIARGVIDSVVSRVATMAGQAAGAPYYLTGGLCENVYVVERLAALLGLRSPPRPRLPLPVPSARRFARLLDLRGVPRHAHPQSLAQNQDGAGSGTYLAALVREQIETGHRAAVLCGAAPGDTQGDIPAGVPVYTVDFDTPELPFHICGMSDVMPYPSTRYRDLTPSMLKAFERAFAAAIDRAVAEFGPIWCSAITCIW